MSKPMTGNKAERALSELLELVTELSSEDRYRHVVQDLKCAETVETVEDWHANMLAALNTLSLVSRKSSFYQRVFRIKELVPA